MKKKLIVLCGPPCSGKSTYARFLCRNCDYIRVNKDDVRTMMNGESKVYKWENEKITGVIADEAVDILIKAKKNIVVDNTHCSWKYLNYYILLGKEISEEYDIYFEFFDTPWYKIVYRNIVRKLTGGNFINWKDIRRLFDNYKATKEAYVKYLGNR